VASQRAWNNAAIGRLPQDNHSMTQGTDMRSATYHRPFWQDRGHPGTTRRAYGCGFRPCVCANRKWLRPRECGDTRSDLLHQLRRRFTQR